MKGRLWCPAGAAVWMLVCLWSAVARCEVLPFEVLGVQQGLPQSQAAALAQDGDGYLWVGTWGGGLARYNGERFISYSRGDGLPTGRVQELLVARDGTLWVALVGGLARWTDHRLEVIDVPAVLGGRWRTLAEDATGRLWAGGDRGLVVLEGAEWRQVPLSRDETPTVHDLLADAGTMLAVTSTGLYKFRLDGTAERLPPPPVSPEVMRAAARTTEGLWIGTFGDGLYLGDGEAWRRLDRDEMGGQIIYRLRVGRSGTLYVATQDAGLFRRPVGGDVFEPIDVARGLPSELVNDVLEDDEDNLWVATDIGGLARLRSDAVTLHGLRGEFPSRCIFGITAGADPDTLWVATMAGAVHYRVHPRFEVLETVTTDDGLRENHVWKVVETPQGEAWVQSETAYHRRRPGERRFTEVDGLPLPAITQDVSLDGDGNLWFSGYDEETPLAMRDPAGRWRTWDRAEDGTPLHQSRMMAPRRAGGVWLIAGTDILAADGVTVRTEASPPFDTYLTVLLEDSRGRLWTGNDAGIAVRDPGGRWRTITDVPGLNSTQAFFAGEGRDGTVWVGTHRGVGRFLPDGSVLPFSVEDGLADLETNQFAFHAERSGAVWLGTIGGLTRYDPSRYRPLTTPPRLVVEAVDLPDRQVTFPEALDLSWRERTVTFHLALLSFRGHDRARYRARLEGMEDQWLPLRPAGELRYTNLPPGRHRLLLQAVNEEGAWSEEVALPVVVHPPFWVTGWFQGSALALAAVLGIGAHRVRTHLLRRRNLDLERVVARRTEELVEANRELERLATHEPVTGLPNRRAIVDRLRQQTDPTLPSSRRFGCLIVDLDRFKQVNDLHGHAEGDRVLRAMAARISGELRDGDVVGRYGGDEFLVVLPGADLAALEAVAQRIGALALTVGEGELRVTITASCGGVAVLGGAHCNEHRVLAAADGLLYEVKRGGRSGARVEALGRPVAYQPGGAGTEGPGSAG